MIFWMGSYFLVIAIGFDGQLAPNGVPNIENSRVYSARS